MRSLCQALLLTLHVPMISSALSVFIVLSASTPASAARFAVVVPDYDDAPMALLIQGRIVAGDTDRMTAAVDAAERNHADHRLRAVALDSIGGVLSEAERMAGLIRSRGLVTAVPDGAQCTSACVLLFAAGSRKIASAAAAVGVHGVADASGKQSRDALATTTNLARQYAAFGVPASVIGRMVVTPPKAIAKITNEEIEMFPWGAVVPRLRLAEVPYALAGRDYELRQFLPPKTGPGYQQAGPALQTPAPPLDTFSVSPPHTPRLIREATDFSAGYAYGESIGETANCRRQGSDWQRGCLAGGYEREKFDPLEGCLARASDNPDPGLASAARAMCAYVEAALPKKVSAASQAEVWLRSYDQAYTTKTRAGGCGNGFSPDNDGCRAGAGAWPRTENAR